MTGRFTKITAAGGASTCSSSRISSSTSVSGSAASGGIDESCRFRCLESPLDDRVSKIFFVEVEPFAAAARGGHLDEDGTRPLRRQKRFGVCGFGLARHAQNAGVGGVAVRQEFHQTGERLCEVGFVEEDERSYPRVGCVDRPGSFRGPNPRERSRLPYMGTVEQMMAGCDGSGGRGSERMPPRILLTKSGGRPLVMPPMWRRASATVSIGLDGGSARSCASGRRDLMRRRRGVGGPRRTRSGSASCVARGD